MTTIEWTEQSWNVVTGCDRISPGCDHCYALTMAKRLKGMGSAKYQNDGHPATSGPGFGITGHPDTLTEPLRWKKPRKVFVNSMSDLFHARVTTSLITDVWKIMAATPQHTYQILTKRASRLAPVLAKVHAELGLTEPLPNVWLGVSVENQKYADLRIPGLLQAPTAVRFLSCEPLLGPVDLRLPVDHSTHERDYTDGTPWPQCLDCSTEDGPTVDWTIPDGPRVNWVIVGGESGHGARPMNPEWAADLVDQCRSAGAAPFVKQLGSVWAHNYATGGDTKGGNPDHWPTALRVREYPAAAS